MPIKDDIAYWTGVLATVPEAQRGEVEAKIIALQEGGLRQADYSKLSAEAQAAKKAADELLAQNREWFTARKAALEEVDDLRAKVAAGVKESVVGDTPFALPKDLISEKILKERLDLMERQAVGFITETQALVLKHFKDFGEILDTSSLVTDPRAQQIGIQGVYNEKFKEQIAKRTTDAENAKAEAFRVEGEQRVMERLAAQRGPGYPVVGNEASSLDAIEAARTSADHKVQVKTLDEISAEYNRLNASRLGGSP